MINEYAIGGLVLIDRTTGKILYWDLTSEYSKDENDVTNMNFENMFILADDLNMFLSKISKC